LESIIHSDLKNDLYISLLRNGYSVEIEKKLGRDNIPDITLELNRKIIAIEIQRSPLPPKAILKKMKAHTRAGAYTLWLLDPNMLQTFIRRKKWCEVIQEVSNGYIFIPTMSTEIIPARIDYLLGSNKKFVNFSDERIDFDELVFDHNDRYGLNIMVWRDWWLDNYVDWLDIYSHNF
jgi:competence CoiA-like predicted nuclease